MARTTLPGLILLLAILPAAAAELPAHLAWVQRAELSTPVSGSVARVLVEPGQRVAKGVVLLQLDARGYQARLAEAQAALTSATRDQAEAAKELERAKELYDRTVLSNHDLEVAHIGADKAAAALEKAKARLTEAQMNLDYSAIRAPFDAWVVARQVEPGETVASQLAPRTLLVVAAAGRMQALAAVGETELRHLKVGSRATVSVAGHHYKGHVRRIGLEALPGKAGARPRFQVAVEFAVGAPLRAGESAKVSLP